MSALGHYLEEEGIAAVAISLIRPQTENTKAPRALWVPFELGRPFGPPGDAAFQKRVVLAALRLLERDGGPVIIEDFPDDDPRAQPDPAWRPPALPAAAPDAASDAIAARLEAEIGLLGEAHRRFVAQYGRTALSLSGLPIADCGRYVAGWLRGLAPSSSRKGFSAPLLLRFAVDDVKAYFLEAAAAGPVHPSSRQLGDWLWKDSAAGAAIYRLRAMYMTAEDERLKLIAGNFMVPGTRQRSAS